MRTRKASVTFQNNFTLNREAGELPAGTYEIEIDEEEIQAADHIAYRRIAVYFYAYNAGRTRSIAVTPKDLDEALKRDTEPHAPR